MPEPTLQTVDRALTLLELLARHRDGLRPVDLTVLMGLNKVTVHRLLSTLAQRGFIERDSSGHRWLLGLKMIELSSLRLNSLELKTEAQPILRRLIEQTGQAAHLAIRDRTEIVYIEKMETVHSMRMYSQIGKRSPAFSTALGKVLLAALPDEDLAAMLDRAELKPLTAGTITDTVTLARDIRQTRQRGYALDREENEPGICCLAAPVYDYRGQMIAAISTAGDRRDYLDDPGHPMIGQVKEAARQISRRMGYVEEQIISITETHQGGTYE